MHINLKPVQSFAFLSSLFLIAIPLVTFFRYYNNPEIFKVAILLFVNLISVLIFLNSPREKTYNDIKHIEFSAFRLTIFSLLCLLPLFFFVGRSVQGYSLLEIAIFTQEYRQGVYSGSGIYTAWATQILSLIIFVILINNGPSKSLLVPVLVVVFASLILGLRVLFWGLVVGYMLAILKNLNAKKIILGVCSIFLFISYKYLINNQEDIALRDLFLDQLTRPDLHAIVKYEFFSENLIKIVEYFPYVRYLFGHDVASFKDFYIATIPNLNTLMPYVSLASGVALPGYVIFYNYLFVLAIIPIVFILSILFDLIIAIQKKHQILIKFLYSYLFIVLSIMLLEDVNVIYKLEQDIIFVLLSYILFIPIRKKSLEARVL